MAMTIDELPDLTMLTDDEAVKVCQKYLRSRVVVSFDTVTLKPNESAEITRTYDRDIVIDHMSILVSLPRRWWQRALVRIGLGWTIRWLIARRERAAADRLEDVKLGVGFSLWPIGILYEVPIAARAGVELQFHVTNRGKRSVTISAAALGATVDSDLVSDDAFGN